MNLNFMQTKQMTTEQAQAIDTALQAHGIRVPDGGGYGSFDWLCERIEGSLEGYLNWKRQSSKRQSRSEILTDIKRLQTAFDQMGEMAKKCLLDIAPFTDARKVLHHTGLDNDVEERLYFIIDPSGPQFEKYRYIPDSINFEWFVEFYNSNPQPSIESITWEMIEQSCRLALSDNPPKTTVAATGLENPDVNIVEAWSPNTKGGRPIDEDKQELVKWLADDFHSATGRCATETPNGPFDDFLSACLAVVETPPKERKNNRKLIRKALEHVPKPRRIN